VEVHLHLWRGLRAVQVKAGVVDDAGAPKYNVHSLRHWYASFVIDLGFPPKRVQTLLGHSSIQMTFDTYGHLFPSAEDDEARLAKGEAAFLREVGG
jgi:integrase